MLMFLLKRPTEEQIKDFLVTAQGLPLSYPEVGAMHATPPPDYKVDHNFVPLGAGAEVFEHAVGALKHWKHFDLGWVQLLPADAQIQVGVTVAVLVNHSFLWSLNACQIVYVIDEHEDTIRRFGFAYGTTTQHAERGEERFIIEWNATDETVSYDILAFSKPGHWLAKFAYPLTRWWQKRFARDSMKAMLKQLGTRAAENI